MEKINNIYLCKPGGVTMGVLSGVDENTASLHMNIVSPWELSFEVYRYIGNEDGFEETDYYHSISDMMELYLDVDGENVRFQIDGEPAINGDGVNEKKSVTAHSIEAEMEKKFLRNFKINCGVEDSQEYLVGYYNDNDEFVTRNINPVTGLPVDYIVVYNDYAERLAEVKNEINNMTIEFSPDTGEVTNAEAIEYLGALCDEYQRLECDPQEDGKCKIYLRHIILEKDEGETTVVNRVFLGHDTTQEHPTFSLDYLIHGIDSLISYYSVFQKQLSLLDLALENAKVAGWSIGEVPQDLRHKKFNFEIGQQNLLSFFKQDCTKSMKVLFDFDRFERKVNVIDVASETDEVRDTGVFLTFRNLIQSIDVTSSNEDGMITSFYPTGANDLGILYANFGEPSIVNLDWQMTKVNEYGEYQYVSEDLRSHYLNWRRFRDEDPYSEEVGGETYSGTRREVYRELSRAYNQKMVEIDEIMNLLPVDDCEIDYTQYTFDELNLAYKAYLNSLEAIEQMYMADVGAVSFNRNTLEAYDAAGNPVKSIKDTFYWHDFDCYFSTIIPNVLTALVIYVDTKGYSFVNPNDPDQYNAETGDWIAAVGGNKSYQNHPEIVTENMADVYKYDMQLYGIVECENKRDAWAESAAVFYRPGFAIRNGVVIDPVPADNFQYNTPDEAGWNRLSDEQKEKFTGKDSFIKYLNQYLDYVSTEPRQNSLTKSVSVGVIQLAKDRIAELQTQLEPITAVQNEIQEKRKVLANACALDKWAEFTTNELNTIYTLIRDGDYNNPNILITNLDDIVKTVDAQEELYQDSITALYERSRPQLSFSINSDNLFALEDFAVMRDQVKLLNYIRVSIGLYEDEFVKLRIVGITRNPMVKTAELGLEFSNMVYSLQELSDFAYLFDAQGGGASGGSGGSGGGGSGGYGSDTEIQLSNNMLNALLKSKTYSASIGNAVVQGVFGNTDGIGALMASSGIFENLQTGDVVVSGNCITDHIKSSNYDAVANTGSYLNLKDGTFTYADGKLTYDGETLDIDGNVRIGDDVAIGEMTAGEIHSQFEVLADSITSEVKRAKEVEAELTASFSGTYTPTASNYPASSWNTDELKESHENDTFYDTSTGKTYVWAKSSDGVVITFSSSSQTEQNFDYVRLYYQSSDGTYPMSQQLWGGLNGSLNGIAGVSVFIPASTFYLYWYTDSSVEAYGWSIESVRYVSSGAQSFIANSNLPRSVDSVRTLSNLPQSSHPYLSNTREMYQINTGYSVSGVEEYRWVLVENEDVTRAVSKIEQLPDSITLSVENGTLSSPGSSASIKLSVTDVSGSTTTSSGNITLSGNVIFKSNLTDGETTISGSNITTGVLSSANGVSTINLTNGTFNFGNGGLVYNGSDLTINGNLYGTNWSITKEGGFIYNDINKIRYNGTPVCGVDITNQVTKVNVNGLTWSFIKVIQFPFYVIIEAVFETGNSVVQAAQDLLKNLPIPSTSGMYYPIGFCIVDYTGSSQKNGQMGWNGDLQVIDQLSKNHDFSFTFSYLL